MPGRRPISLTRREWVQLVGAGTATAALGCGDNTTPIDGSAMICEVTPEAMVVSLWAARASDAMVDVRDAAAPATSVAQLPIELGPSGTAAVDVTGLVPDHAYEIRVELDRHVLGPYRVRTAPPEDDPRPIRIAVSADLDPIALYDNELVEHIVAAQPELFVSLGDFPYTDDGPPAMTLDEYRARHAALRRWPRVRRLFETVSVRAIYDDHEFHNDWDPTFVAEDPARYQAAMQAWDEFFPLRDPAGDIRYRRWRWGAHTECFLLDCRRFRDANAAPDGPTKTMLGATQRAWLIDGVTTSPATFKLVFSTVPLDYATGDDSWIAFTAERAAILDAIVGTPGVLWISGDQHYFAAYRHDHGVREFQIGPMARGIGTAGPTDAGVLFRQFQSNVGVIDIDGESLTMTGIGDDGEQFYSETLTADDLTPR